MTGANRVSGGRHGSRTGKRLRARSPGSRRGILRVAAASLVIAGACATAPTAPDREAAPRAGGAEAGGAQGALRYDHPERAVETIIAQWERLYERELVAKRTRLDGPPTRALLAESGFRLNAGSPNPLEAYLSRLLLEHDDVYVELIEPRGHPVLEGKIVYVVFPSGANAPPTAHAGLGWMFMFGQRNDPGRPAPELREAVAAWKPAARTDGPPLPALPRLTPESLAQRLSAGERFVLFIASERCGASRAFAPYFDEVWPGFGVQLPAYLLVLDDFSKERPPPFPRRHLSTPSLAYVEDGSLLDLQSGGGGGPLARRRLAHFLARNGLVEGPVGYAWDATGEPEDRAVRLRSLARVRSWPATDFTGADLSGGFFKGGNFAGSSFRGAVLRDTNLEGAVLTRADLAGADLTGARLDHVLWGRTVCPDGTVSDANGGTCEGHLEAR